MRIASLTLAALITAPGLAFAQSVLERVLGQIDSATNLAQVNGTFANIAENVARTPIPGVTTTEVTSIGLADAADNVILWIIGDDDVWITVADIGKTFVSGDGSAIGAVLATDTIDKLTVNSDGSLSFTAANATGLIPLSSMTTGSTYLAGNLTADTYELGPTGLVYEAFGSLYLTAEFFANANSDLFTLQTQEITTTSRGTLGISSTIDGSITNIVTGVTAATAEAVAGSATATEFVMPTVISALWPPQRLGRSTRAILPLG